MKNWKQVIAWTAYLGIITPGFVFAESAPETANAAAAVRDISLDGNNRLVGQVLNAEGQAIANTEVTVSSADQSTIKTSTDTEGYFQVDGLKGGLYQVNCLQQSRVYRLWTARTAPPAASSGLLMVQQDVLRGQTMCNDGCMPGGYPVDGQCGYAPCPPDAGHGLLGMLANPWVIGAVVAVAVAVPLALDDDAS